MKTSQKNHKNHKNLPAVAVSVTALLLLLTPLFPAAGARAGEAENPWLIGFDLLGSNFGEDENSADSIVDQEGGGAALQFGYRFGPSFLVRLYASGALHETTNPDLDILFSGGLIEGVYLFRPGQRFRPYVFGGLGGFSLESQLDNFTYSAEGAGASLGGGLYYFFTPHVSLHSSLRYEAVNWDTLKVTMASGTGTIEAEVPIDESGDATKVTLGMSFWF